MIEVEFEIRPLCGRPDIGWLMEARRPGMSGDTMPVAPGLSIPLLHPKVAKAAPTLAEAWAGLDWGKI